MTDRMTDISSRARSVAQASSSSRSSVNLQLPSVLATPSVLVTPRNVLPTPRSLVATTRSLVEPPDAKVIAAIVEGRGHARGEVGIACIHIQTAHLVLCQFTDTQTYHKAITKLNIFRPHQILMPATCIEASGTPSQLFLQLKAEAANVEIKGIQRKIFDDAKGLQRIKQLVVDRFSPVIHMVTQKYYCLAAAAALIKYVELDQSVIFSSRSIKVEFQPSEATCMIDSVTAQNLELLINSHQPKSPHSLLGLLSNCRTPGGSRLLRMDILQPPCDLRLIQQRLDCVAELIDKREEMCGLQDILSRIPVDVDHVICSLIQIPNVDNARTTEQRINSLIALKHTLELLPLFVTVLENTEQECLLGYRQGFQSEGLTAMLDQIKTVVNDETQVQKGASNMKRQRCFAIKADVHPLLDISRKAYCEILEDAQKYVSNLSEDLDMALRLGQNIRGFYINFQLSGRNDRIPDIPARFLHVRKHQNGITFTTEVMLSMDIRMKEIENEIESISSRVIAGLLTNIRQGISGLYQVSDAIANLDLLYALANYSLTTMTCVRPRFSKMATSITNGRHPVLDQISSWRPPVPNNTFLSEDANLAIVTGPNMSGKTTYLKQVATLQILAQLGSFVPADAATFRIASNIFSRLGTGDNIEDGASSFSVEMNEMNYILNNINDNSLVIIDELGRGTSIEEGTAISWAIAEELMKTKSFIIFATHYMHLTKMEAMYINVLNFTLETQEWELAEGNVEDVEDSINSRRLKYTHVLKRGVTEIENYGLKLAKTTSYPAHVVDRAIIIAEGIAGRKTNDDAGTTKPSKRKALYLLGCQLKLATELRGAMSKEGAKEYLRALQADFKTSFPDI